MTTDSNIERVTPQLHPLETVESIRAARHLIEDFASTDNRRQDLREINARVHCIVHRICFNYNLVQQDADVSYYGAAASRTRIQPYAQSQDVIKSITPAGWIIDLRTNAEDDDLFQCYIFNPSYGMHGEYRYAAEYTVGGHTEQLAQLNAILSALAYDLTQAPVTERRAV